MGLEGSKAISGRRPTPSASCAWGEAVKYSFLNYVFTAISTTFLSHPTSLLFFPSSFCSFFTLYLLSFPSPPFFFLFSLFFLSAPSMGGGGMMARWSPCIRRCEELLIYAWFNRERKRKSKSDGTYGLTKMPWGERSPCCRPLAIQGRKSPICFSFVKKNQFKNFQ